MAIRLEEKNDGRTVDVHVSGMVGKDDFVHFAGAFERLFSLHGKLRVLLDMTNFHGFSAGAAWQETKFNLIHFNDIDRLAMIGEKKWQEVMAKLCRPFTNATVKYFDQADGLNAHTWLAG